MGEDEATSRSVAASHTNAPFRVDVDDVAGTRLVASGMPQCHVLPLYGVTMGQGPPTRACLVFTARYQVTPAEVTFADTPGPPTSNQRLSASRW